MYFEVKSTLNSNYCKNIKHYLSVFGIVIKVFFESILRLKIHQNNIIIFYF